MIDWQPRAKQLAETITAQGGFTDPRWRAAFEATPRHLFVPRYWELGQYNIPTTLIDGANPEQREQWLDACYTNRTLITHWTGENGRRILTSSASQPSLVAHMLHLLNVTDGQRVLEVGAGTGFNAALLCHRLGDQQVATIDIDPVLAAEAQTHLARLGHQPQVQAGDGTAGLPDHSPFDAILCTCAAATVPDAWIEQLNPGGVIVAPLTFGGALAVLRKTGPGRVSGRLDDQQVYFMPLHEADRAVPDGFVVDRPQQGLESPPYQATTDIPLEAWAEVDFRLWLAIHLPGTHLADLVDDQLNRTGVVVYNATHQANVDYARGEFGCWPTGQDNGRLWDAVETTWRLWQRYDRPSRARIGISAEVGGQQWVWLDQETGPLRWPLPQELA